MFRSVALSQVSTCSVWNKNYIYKCLTLYLPKNAFKLYQKNKLWDIYSEKYSFLCDFLCFDESNSFDLTFGRVFTFTVLSDSLILRR